MRYLESESVKADLEAYRVDAYTYRLLCQWGRNYMIGSPRLGYKGKCPTCRDYLSPYPDEKPSFDMDDFDRITAIIDNCLSQPKQEALRCRFRYTDPEGRGWNKRRSARSMGLSVEQYLGLLRSAMRRVDVNFNGSCES